MKQIGSRFLAGALLIVPLGSAWATPLDLTPGKFLLTVTYEIQGQQPGKPNTSSRCIAASDLDNPEKIFNDRAFAGFKADESCTVKNLKNADGRISYDADCSNRVAHVEGTLLNAEFSVVRDVKPKSSRGVSLKLTLTGKRTGDCSK
jgi:hypothetical protein